MGRRIETCNRERKETTVGGVREGEVQGKPIVVSDIEWMKESYICRWRVAGREVFHFAVSKKQKQAEKTQENAKSIFLYMRRCGK